MTNPAVATPNEALTNSSKRESIYQPPKKFEINVEKLLFGTAPGSPDHFMTKDELNMWLRRCLIIFEGLDNNPDLSDQAKVSVRLLFEKVMNVPAVYHFPVTPLTIASVVVKFLLGQLALAPIKGSIHAAAEIAFIKSGPCLLPLFIELEEEAPRLKRTVSMRPSELEKFLPPEESEKKKKKTKMPQNKCLTCNNNIFTDNNAYLESCKDCGSNVWLCMSCAWHGLDLEYQYSCGCQLE